jgi:deferrochelatase/peroxidase EfeB
MPLPIQLELADIQGHIVRAYGRDGFPTARHFFLNIADAAAGRHFVDQVRDKVTTAEPWRDGEAKYPTAAPPITKPKVAINIGFTFHGLRALGLPTRTLQYLPAEFIEGMAARCHILGDIGESAPERWDPIWRHPSDLESPRMVHVWLAMHPHLESGDALERETAWLRQVVAESGGKVTLLTGHRGPNEEFQAASALVIDGQHVPKEHFGYTDAIGDTVFVGQTDPGVERIRVVGSGKLTADQQWEPIATGEFVLGHVDESQELPQMAPPWEFMRNGTFMAYRKLHQNVGSFYGYIDRTADLYAQIMSVPLAEARETVRAKLVGRWSDGVPLMAAPTFQAWTAFREQYADVVAWWEGKTNGKALSEERKGAYMKALVDFRYRDDPRGISCPFGAHLRRVNTRDMLDPRGFSKDPKDWNGSVLNNRRRILRRGLPYGSFDPDDRNDEGEHGVIFMGLCASLFRQFEFIQQQWLQYGLDFNLGNDTDPLVGNRKIGDAKFVITADPAGDKPPFICTDMPQFVTTRGGEYFFIPSLTALRMIAMGNVDPT